MGLPSRTAEQVFRDRQRVLARERFEAPGLFVELTNATPSSDPVLSQDSPRLHTWGVFELLDRTLFGDEHPQSRIRRGVGVLALRCRRPWTRPYGGELIEICEPVPGLTLEMPAG